MHFALAMAAAALVVPASALAGTPSSNAAAPTKATDGDKIICKSERIVGSNLSTRICHTKAEWAAGLEHDKRWLDQNNGKLYNDTLIKGEGGGMHISTSTPGARPH